MNLENLLFDAQKERDALRYENENLQRELQKFEKVKGFELQNSTQKVSQLQAEL